MTLGHAVIAIVCSLVVGAGCGYGFRGYIGHKRDEAVAAAQGALQGVAKKL